MEILGIGLHAPTTKSLVVVCILTLITFAITALFAQFGVVNYSTMLHMTIAVFAGSLSNAFGVSISKFGWRGVVLCLMFVCIFIGLLDLIFF